MLREKVLGIESSQPVGTHDALKGTEVSHQHWHIHVPYQYEIYFTACPFRAGATDNVIVETYIAFKN